MKYTSLFQAVIVYSFHSAYKSEQSPGVLVVSQTLARSAVKQGPFQSCKISIEVLKGK